MKKMKKMKNLFVLLSVFVIGCSGVDRAPEEFVITGKFPNNVPIEVMLTYTDDQNNPIKEKYLSTNGEFSFKGKTLASSANLFVYPYISEFEPTQPEYWKLFNKVVAENKYLTQSRTFFLEAGNFEFTGDSDLISAKLKTKSENQELFNTYIKEYEKNHQRYFNSLETKELYDSIPTKKINIDSLNRALLEHKKQFIDFPYEFAQKYPNSKISLVALKAGDVSIGIEKLATALDVLSKDLQSTAVVAALKNVITVAQRNDIGKTAIDFSLQDINGQRKNLRSYRGKYVLVDFWASWCGPCRAENPNVLKAYNKFKGENFDIISISLDRKKEAWLKAVKKDKLPWLNLLDEPSAEKSMGSAYGILGIPSNVLIDPNGIIVAKDLRGEELHEKLSVILKK